MPRLWIQIATIVVMILAVYRYAPNARFMPIDDGSLSYKNPIVINADIRGAFSTFDPELYVPLTLISYQIDYAIGKEDPAVYHTTNLVLHIINAILVLLIVRFFSKRWAVPFLTAMLFAVHPLNTEAVMWIAGRKDLLCATFFLGSLLAYCHFRVRQTRAPYYLSIVLYLFALLSKVIAVTLPLLLMIVDDLIPTKTRDREKLSKWAYYLPAIVFLFIGMQKKALSVYALSYFDAALIAIKAVYFYLSKLLVPTNLSLFYKQVTPIDFFRMEFFLPAVFLVLLGMATVHSRRIGKPFAFGIMWFGITLLPNLANAVKGSKEAIYYASDRYAYLPSIGIFFLCATGLSWLAYTAKPRLKLWITVIATSMVIVYASLAHSYSSHWLTPKPYMQRVQQLYPDTAMAHTLRGILLLEQEQVAEAVDELRTARELEPEYTDNRAHLGLALIKNGEIDEGIRELYATAKIQPSYDYTYIFLAYAYVLQNDLNSAEHELQKALGYNPKSAGALQLLGTIEHARGNLDAAEKYYRESLVLNNRSVRAKSALARVLQEKQL